MQKQCSVCQSAFVPKFAYQIAVTGAGKQFFCRVECRRQGLGADAFRAPRARRIAILNQKGGTGKTTTAINLAAGLADRGGDVLLIDTDAQGNVGASLGIRGERSLYHMIVEGAALDEVAIPVRGQLDVVTADATLAMAEVWLARLDAGRDQVLKDRLDAAMRRRYQFVLLDCGPSLSLLNQNALRAADEVIIPVACDYLALVGVNQVLRTLKDIERHLHHAVRITAVVPTFFDSRIRLANEALETLRSHFKDRLFDPIRRSTKLAEAPSHRKTIFEYSPDSNGAHDYRKLVERLFPEVMAARAA